MYNTPMGEELSPREKSSTKPSAKAGQTLLGSGALQATDVTAVT